MTGHNLTKYFQEQKVLIKNWCIDQGIAITETSDTIIMRKDGKIYEMKPKKSEYKDIANNRTHAYYNPIPCINRLFNIELKHGL